MVQVFNGGYSNTDRTTTQRLRRFHQVYLRKLVEFIIPSIENLNKVVEVRLSDLNVAKDPKAKRPYKLTYLLKEIMGLTIMKEEEELRVVQSCIPVARGMGAGTAKVTVRADFPEALELVDNLRRCPAGFFFGYWTSRGWKETCVQTLMESFEIEAAQLAGFANFNTAAMRVTSPYAEEDDFLEMVEEELGLGAFTEAPKLAMSIDLGEAKEALASTLREKDDLSEADKTGHSKRTGANGSSCGAETDRSQDTMAKALNGREQALQNAQLRAQNAKMQEEQRRKDDANREEMDRLRAQLEQARASTEGQGASPSKHDDLRKTTFGVAEGEC